MDSLPKNLPELMAYEPWGVEESHCPSRIAHFIFKKNEGHNTQGKSFNFSLVTKTWASEVNFYCWDLAGFQSISLSESLEWIANNKVTLHFADNKQNLSMFFESFDEAINAYVLLSEVLTIQTVC